jgi:hypothetical protein
VAADTKVRRVPDMKASIDALIREFERTWVVYEIYAGQKQHIGCGDCDVAIFARSQIDEINN